MKVSHSELNFKALSKKFRFGLRKNATTNHIDVEWDSWRVRDGFYTKNSPSRWTNCNKSNLISCFLGFSKEPEFGPKDFSSSSNAADVVSSSSHLGRTKYDYYSDLLDNESQAKYLSHIVSSLTVKTGDHIGSPSDNSKTLPQPRILQRYGFELHTNPAWEGKGNTNRFTSP
jgi:hypothetical protein